MPTVADLLQPEWANLLVERDQASEVVGVGLAGAALVAPSQALGRMKPNSGRVLKAGPQAPACYQPGAWVLWGDGAATELALGGDRKVALLSSQYVLAWIKVEDVEAIVKARQLDISTDGMIPFLYAPPGHYLIERLEMPVARGRIIIPDGANLRTRSCEAVVIAGDEEPYRPYDKVFLAGSVSRSFWAGRRRLWVCLPGQIPARLLADPGEAGVVPEEEGGVTVGMRDLLLGQDDDAALDEGDARAPR